MSDRAWEASATALAVMEAADGVALNAARAGALGEQEAAARAGALVLADLRQRGWRTERSGLGITLSPPETVGDRLEERARMRADLQLERRAQLRSPAVQDFLDRMERSAVFEGRLVSIFDLMGDGAALAATIRGGAWELSDLIRPYVQIVEPGARCAHTGILLSEIWRYFRHTWSTPYRSTPGRGVQVLVRDAAGARHPVIGLIMLGSAPSQISVRDAWIGWSAEALVKVCTTAPSDTLVAWVEGALRHGVEELRVDDLLAGGSLSPTELLRPTPETVARLHTVAALARAEHGRFANAASIKLSTSRAMEGGADWEQLFEQPLFRAKRCTALAKLLQASLVLHREGPLTPAVLGRLARSPAGAQALATLARQEKASRMGSGIADVVVCGAVSPYRELLGGKLMALIAVSREVRGAWERRYLGASSIIASSLAGRPVERSPRLAVLTTTALYGRPCAQYDRARLRLEELSLGLAGEVRYHWLGETCGWGTSQLSDDAVEALSLLVSQRRGGQRVDSVFGEGVNPRLRKVRDGLVALGLPADLVLRHGRRRGVYGVDLGSDARAWLRGMAPSPGVFDDGCEPQAMTDAIGAYWRRRWLAPRLCRQDVLTAVARHTLSRPVRHGARVVREEEVGEER